MIIKDLFSNLTILVSLLFLYSHVSNKHPLHTRSPIIKKIVVGALGGLLSNILMQYSIHIDKTIIDLRHIPIILLAYYGGALPTLVSMILVIIGRLMIGMNHSAYTSIVCVVIVTLFSIYISDISIKRRIRILLMLTFSNIVFTVLFFFLIKDLTLLIILLPIYWLASYLAGIIAFYTLDFLRNSQKLFNKFRMESRIDGLTGLNNVRKFDEVFNQLISDLKVNNKELALLYIDIDHFKQINDTYGHTEGDLVLKELGIILLNCTTPTDVVSRNGGEEFSVLLLNCKLNQAVNKAEKIRKTVEANHFILNNGEGIKLTISIGVASFPDTTLEPTLLMEDSDRALYRAKQSGRNKVCIAT